MIWKKYNTVKKLPASTGIGTQGLQLVSSLLIYDIWHTFAVLRITAGTLFCTYILRVYTPLYFLFAVKETRF